MTRFPPGPRPALEDIPGSLIREVSEAGRGIPGLIRLFFGEPDTVTPAFIRAAAKAALDAGETFYAPNPGIAPLREAISRYLTRNGRPVGAERVSVTASGVNALMLVAQALLSPGDRVVIPMPAWPNMDGIARVMGAHVTPLPIRIANGVWRVDMDELLATVTPATRLLFLNSPGNPTGWTLTAEEQRVILDHCRRTGTWILADDVYERLYFAGDAAPSFLSIATTEDRVVSVNSFSKAWSMTGWRLGWIAAPPALMDSIAKLNEFNMSSAPTFVQHAGVVALDQGDAFIAETQARYRACRDLALGILGAVPGVTAPRPDGAMYLFLRVEGCTDSLALAKSLLTSAGVGLAPGAAFGAGGEGHLRLCFAQSEDRLRTACTRVAQALAAGGAKG
ncbi:aminotransferase class I/II-fold pyridoxal phosphate-dependent enzyme [Roseomonas eburnea]|uniref:Aminotransferase n=1 Tax=Neoroseomonas eburnea TaxID=1346889 RepID=A0A9X9XCB2_9PROT|nr:pyridoxal phosphate-dependent aminotransferase [Neoroseomonas eburnea]MBR0681348.1 aminotransferase class I/II-fold pyridoxal phosphate-dependent enzyme [Neoroseomonas eburnea]